MSDETQVIEEGSELLPVPATEKKSKGKGLATAAAAGLAVGIGAIAYDAHAEESERLTAPSDSDSKTTPADSSNTDNHVPQDSVPAENHPAPAPSPSDEPFGGLPDPVQLIPDHIHVLNAPDTMSFDQAFEWARETAGPAQLFEWNGELYHTCHSDEYALLPHETKEVFETLWLANEADPASVIGLSEEEVVYDIDVDDKTNELWITEAPDVIDTTTPVPTEAAVQPDSTSMDNESYDFTYTEEDFDNDFEGTDEWVNPEDEIA